MEKLIKSPMNYVGGKYKLLPQIIPLFPDEINTFVDLFCGGLSVSMNVKANKIIANDYNKFIIEIFEAFKNNSIDAIINHIESRISEYKLSKTNAEGFNSFREYYNSNQNPLDLYTLVCYSFNYQFRFNNSLKYNNPFGKNRSQFSNALKIKLIKFIEEYQNKNIELRCEDFNKFRNLELGNDDFVYCDPPYLITTGSYNDGNRGFKNWEEEEEKELLDYLNYLDSKKIKFALSNVLEHKGLENDILKKWAKNYKINYLNYNYDNCNYQNNNKKNKTIEVLITNY